MNTQIKTITCICGTRTKVGMYKRTCGSKKCTAEWKDMVQRKAQLNQTYKKHMKILFGAPLKS